MCCFPVTSDLWGQIYRKSDWQQGEQADTAEPCSLCGLYRQQMDVNRKWSGGGVTFTPCTEPGATRTKRRPRESARADGTFHIWMRRVYFHSAKSQHKLSEGTSRPGLDHTFRSVFTGKRPNKVASSHVWRVHPHRQNTLNCLHVHMCDSS